MIDESPQWLAPAPTGDPVRDAVEAAESRARWDRRRYENERAEQNARAATMQEEQSMFLGHCRSAYADDYAEWLQGHLLAGGRITHSYDYPMPRGWHVLLHRPDQVPSLYGAMSVDVIVPAGCPFAPRDIPRTFHGGCGHSTFFFVEGFDLVGSFVPLYPDVRARLGVSDADS